MSQELNTALMLLVVGMLTVFAILFLVVVSGQILIRIVNRYSPEQIKPKSAVSPLIIPPVTNPKSEPSKIAAIIAAVEAVTGGKGRITKITKKDKSTLWVVKLNFA